MTKSADKRKAKKASGPNSFVGVAEQTRIRISQLLEKFRVSHDQVYTFEDNLNNHERAAVHLLCRKVGMKSKSSGTGKQRRVSVYKLNKGKNKSGSVVEQEKTITVTFSDESRRVLTDLFVRYPPGDDEAVSQSLNTLSGNSKSSGRRDDIFRKPVMKKAEIVKKMESLASRYKSIPKLKEISVKRSKLPIASFQNAITSTISAHQVVLISGETGCGKTTQVPQYLLDDMWANGQACKIVCTQPRRISATSVAERISQERGEDIGDSIGYKIRLETKGGRQTSVMFCTTGVLLKVLVSGGANGCQSESSNHSRKVISELTHIIVDEIHERDHYSDFMLTILRDLLPMYPRLRVVLMSATLDAERFSNYFGGCPVIKVPGFTHPVKSFYLEEVLSILKTPEKNHLNASSNCAGEESNLSEETRVALDEAIETALSSDECEALLELISSEGMSKMLNYQHSRTGVSPLMVFAGKGRVGDVCTLLSLGADCHLQARDGSNALYWAVREDQSDTVEILKKHMEGSSTSSVVEEQKLVEKYMSFINPEIVDIVLVEKLLKKICMESQEGAILVFLPGWEEINRTRGRLLANVFFKNSSNFLILALHSMIPSADQKKVFVRPPPGCRKIILSTNIAETAITIDDVVYVVDSGRMKEKNYDPYSNVSTLQSSWISQASAKQREGRAGRCQPGVCYHLFTRLRAASFPQFQMPEIKRIPIDELCLQVKMLDRNCKVEEFLKKTLDPPVSETIKNAVSVLQEIGAFSHDERLTELGEKLAALPVHPSTSKMLFFAILLNCLDPALTLACASDFRDPFTIPMLPDDKKRADAAKAELASLYGGHGDQLALIAAFDCWRKAKEKGKEARFCSEYFVSSGTMFMLSGMRKQLLSELIRSGFISGDTSNCSMNAQEPGIIRAVIVAGLYPMVGKLHQRKKGKRLTVETASGDQVSLHPSSVNSKLSFKSPDERPLLIYDEVIRGDGGLHTRHSTLIGPLALLLIATEIVVAPGKGNENAGDDDGDDSGNDNNDDEDMEGDKTDKQGDKIMSSPDNAVTVVVDRWLSFESTALDVAQIYCLRERLSAAILFKISNPSKVLPPVLGASVYATACLLAYDGLNGISSSVESVDTLTSMVNNTDIGKKKSSQPPNLFLMSLFNAPQRKLSSRGNKPKVEASRRQNHPAQSSQSVPMVVAPPWAPQARIEASRSQNHPAPSFRSVPMVVEPPLVSLQTRPTLAAESLTGYSANAFGPYGPRGDSSKRPRGK